MDVLGVSTVKSQKPFKKARRNRGIKVVYISSPMKVKTSASEFRALVQELTGRHSDAERSFETINGKSGEGSVTMKKQVHEHVDNRETDFGFGFNFGFGLCDFLASPFQDFGNNSIIFN